MWTILSEVADWAAYKLTLDAKKGAADHSIIFQNAIPEMLGRLLSLLTNSQELGLFTESNLLSLRVPIMSMFDSYRTVAYTDSYYDLLELYLASLLATIARNFSQVCWLRLKLMYIALPSSSFSTPSFFCGFLIFYLPPAATCLVSGFFVQTQNICRKVSLKVPTNQ